MRTANPEKNLNLFLTLVFLFSISVSAAFAQTDNQNKNREENAEPKIEKAVFAKIWKTFPVAGNLDETPAEKSITVDEKVIVQFCVSQGNVKVTGWDRDEVRVFINEGSQLGFKVLDKHRKNKKAAWMEVVGYEPSAEKTGKVDECLSGGEIELEVPRNATVNIKSRASKIGIDSVRKVSVKNIGGGIFLNNIAGGIEASTYEGDVTVEKSSGAMALESVSGNVLAFDVEDSEIGDVFKAKTSSGIISLQDIRHRQLEIETNSGSLKFNGAFVEGGNYGFGTTNGSINLIVPSDSSCKISASYGFGDFKSAIPLKNIVKSNSSRVKNLSAEMGGGDCTLNLRTYNGAIVISEKAKDTEDEK